MQAVTASESRLLAPCVKKSFGARCGGIHHNPSILGDSGKKALRVNPIWETEQPSEILSPNKT